jgi:hypothetical protein
MAIRDRRLASATRRWFAMCRTKAEATKTTIEATTKQAVTTGGTKIQVGLKPLINNVVARK